MALMEADLQRALITWAKTQIKNYPQLLWLHHVPSGGKRDSREAQSLQSQGVKAGILDLHLPVARGGYHGLMIEIKRPSNKKPVASPEQVQYMEFLTEQGYATLLSNSFDELKLFITNYLDGNIVRHADA